MGYADFLLFSTADCGTSQFRCGDIFNPNCTVVFTSTHQFSCRVVSSYSQYYLWLLGVVYTFSLAINNVQPWLTDNLGDWPIIGILRSEERRVGKECRFRWAV